MSQKGSPDWGEKKKEGGEGGKRFSSGPKGNTSFGCLIEDWRVGRKKQKREKNSKIGRKTPGKGKGRITPYTCGEAE